jgi:foldase protein PrsA
MKNKKQILIFAAVATVIIVLIGIGIYSLTSDNNNTQSTNTTKTGKEFGEQALKFNGEYVSRDIFVEERNKFFEKWSRNGEMLQKTDEERNDMLLDEIIQRLVIEYTLRDKANITVSSDEVDQYIQNYIKNRYAVMGGLQSYMDGMGFKTETDMRNYVEFYLKRVKYFSKIAQEYGENISDSEMEKEFQEHKLKNTQVTGKRIHFSNSKRSENETLKLATEIYNRLKNGEDFATLAKQYSEDEETKNSGGVMNAITGGIYSDEFDNAVFNASPGQLLPPVANMNGYDIVYVEKLNYFYHPKDELKDMLLTQRFGESEKFKNWLEKAKSGVSIEITDPSFKAYRLYKNKQYTEAGDCYQQAYEGDNFEGTLQRASESYRLAENWDKLIVVSELGMKNYPKQVPYYTDAALAYFKKQDKEKAEKLMKKAENLAKDSIYFKYKVAEAYLNMGWDKDVERINKEITKDGYDPITSPNPSSEK